MKASPFLIAVSVLNLGLLIYSIVTLRSESIRRDSEVLRGRALEIVDERGRPRATITVFPADPNVKMPDGSTGYPETVLLRLINSQGRPNVKIEATEIGAGVGLGGEHDPTYAALAARGDKTLLKMTNQDGKQQIVEP